MRREDRMRIIEELIDSVSVPELLDEISTICFLKAEHIAENWQDYLLAKVWERKGRLIQSLASKVK
jgi:hypothetical protein